MAENNLAPKLVNANLDVIEAEVLTKLPEDLQTVAIAASNALGKTAEVVFDGVTPNGPQVEAIWNEFINQHLINYAVIKANGEIEKITSPVLKNLLSLLVIPTGSTLKALTDTVTDDGKQIEQLWITYILEGDHLKVFLNETLGRVLVLAFKNEQLAATIVALAESQIRILLSERT